MNQNFDILIHNFMAQKILDCSTLDAPILMRGELARKTTRPTCVYSS